MPRLPTGIYHKTDRHGKRRYYGYIDYEGKRYYVPKENEKRGGWSTAKKAASARAAYLIKLEKGYIEPSKMTFQEFVETLYIPDYCALRLKVTTREKKINRVRRYALPEIGHIRLKTLSDTDILKLQHKLLRKTSVKNVRKVLIDIRSIDNGSQPYPFYFFLKSHLGTNEKACGFWHVYLAIGPFP